MAFWQSVMRFVFKHLLNTMTMFYIPSILFFFCDMLQLWGNNGACRAPQSESRSSSTRARCGSWDADYVCLVYKCSSEQIPPFLGLFSLPRIYTHRLSLWHELQTRNIWLCLLENVARGHSLCRQCSSGEWQKYTDDTISYNVIFSQEDRMMTWSL